MFMFVFLLTSAALALGGVPRNFDGKIVGGEEINIEELPYQVSLQYYDSHYCGGAILSEIHVITAAHCTDDFTATYLSVRAGSSNKNSGGQVSQVSFISQHPQYNPRNIDYDVSVLTLKTRLVFGPQVQPINLIPAGVEQHTGTSAVVSGWGKTSSGGSSPTILRKAVVYKVSDNECNRSYGGGITSRMMCYAALAKDSCQGDSGGPLVADGELVGIVSWGVGCADAHYPGVYTRIADPEIQNHINKINQINI